jgi:hypothetical protein
MNELVPITHRNGGVTNLDVKVEGENQFALINNEEIPLIDDKSRGRENICQLTVIHSGTLNTPEKKEKYKEHKGKVYYERLFLSEEELLLVPIAIMEYGRELFPEKYDAATAQLLCASKDGLNPSPAFEHPVSTQCGTCKIAPSIDFQPICPKAIWPDRKTPAACSNKIQVVFFDLKYRIPVELKISGSLWSQWNAVNKQYSDQKTAARVVPGRVLPEFCIKVTAEEETTYTKVTFKLAAASRPEAEYAPLINWYFEHVIAPEKQRRDEILQKQIEEAKAKNSGLDVNMIENADSTNPDEAVGKDFEL